MKLTPDSKLLKNVYFSFSKKSGKLTGDRRKKDNMIEEENTLLKTEKGRKKERKKEKRSKKRRIKQRK